MSFQSVCDVAACKATVTHTGCVHTLHSVTTPVLYAAYLLKSFFQNTTSAMPVAQITTEAYAKIVLHAVEYPYGAVNGVLLGRQEDNLLVIADAVCH